MRASGANSTDQADANAVRLSASGTGGTIVLGSRSANPNGVVSSTTIGDGVGITANDGSISFGTTGKISLGSGSQLQAGGSIDLRGNFTDEITTPFLAKIAGSSRWFIGQAVDIDSTNYTPTSDRSLTIKAPTITIKNFSLAPSASSWQMASGVALDFQATGSGGLNVRTSISPSPVLARAQAAPPPIFSAPPVRQAAPASAKAARSPPAVVGYGSAG